MHMDVWLMYVWYTGGPICTSFSSIVYNTSPTTIGTQWAQVSADYLQPGTTIVSGTDIVLEHLPNVQYSGHKYDLGSNDNLSDATTNSGW